VALTTVYQYFAKNGALIYVGITDRGTRRLHEHAESKPWWKLSTGCTLEHFENREEALAREKQLIQRFRPPYNYQHNPERALPLEERVARRLQGAKPVMGSMKGAPVKDEVRARRQRWQELPASARKLAPCVACQVRPGNGRSLCLVCQQDNRLAMSATAMTASEHRLAHKTLPANERCPYGSGCKWQQRRDAEQATAS
jgi:predicted GIY-YIG superfamily endonuclease